MDLRKLKKLIDLVQESGIAELEITEGEEKVKIVKGGVVSMTAAPAAVMAMPAAAPAPSPAAAAAAAPQSAETQEGHVVKAPMVGTFYRSPSPDAKPFVEVAGDNRTHDLAVDALGVNRDSEGLSVKGGTTFEYSQKLTGELSVGYLTRHYRDIALQSFGGLLLDGALIWTASALTTVKLVTSTSVGESIIPGVSGVFTRELSAQIDHAFRRWLIATAKFSVGVDDYEGSSRLDKRYAASALLTYRATREAWLKAEYRHEWRSSSVAGNDFAADIVLFGVRLQR